MFEKEAAARWYTVQWGTGVACVPLDPIVGPRTTSRSITNAES